MGKTILYIGTSFDGYVAGPNDETEWMDPYGEVEYGFKDFLDTVGAIVMGRRSYDVGTERGWFSSFDYGSPIIVVSEDTPDEISKDASFTFVNNIENALTHAKEIAGAKHIYIYGGANLAMQYLRAGLVDEITVGLMPILLGKGKRLFEGLDKQLELKLIDNKAFDKGLVVIRYSVVNRG